MTFESVQNLRSINKKNKTKVKKSRNKATINKSSPSISILDHHLKTQLSLCDSLEEIADGLPDNIDSQECLHIARSIYATVRRAHDFEENVLFPMLTRSGNSKIASTVDRLRGEHWEDESFAHELQDVLIEFVTHRQHANAETLGYMLRGFFEGVRRHIAFEKEYIVPLVSKAESLGNA